MSPFYRFVADIILQAIQTHLYPSRVENLFRARIKSQNRRIFDYNLQTQLNRFRLFTLNAEKTIQELD